MNLCNFQIYCWIPVLLLQKVLTFTPRSLIPPAPHAIGKALDVGRANAVVPRIATEDDPSSELIVWTVDNPPFPMVQRERAETRAHNDCAKNRGWVEIVRFRLFKLTDFNFLSYPLYTLQAQTHKSM